MKSRAGPKVTFREGGKVGRSYATPIFFLLCAYFSKILGQFWDNFKGSGFTPSYLPTLMKWSLLVLPLNSFIIALSHYLGTNILTLDVDVFRN